MDVNPLIQVVEINAVPLIFLQTVMRKELHQSLQLDFELLFNISKHIALVSREHVPFNGPGLMCLNAHSVYYLTVNNFEKLIDDFEMFAVFFSVLVSKYQHSGLTNDFLVKTRHSTALRYNDITVQESQVLARFTKLLSNPEYNFLILLEALHVDAFRKLVILLVLKLDIARHFDFLSRLQTKLASDRYPDGQTWLNFVTKFSRVPRGDECDDRITLLFTLMRCADLSWACKTPALSGRWADRFTEELFAQGDVEKQVGVPISPFSDRDIVQPQKCQMAYMIVIVYPIVTQYIFTLRSQEGKADIKKEDVDRNDKELIEQGLEATRASLNQKALQGGGGR
jgi:hypothetical protein